MAPVVIDTAAAPGDDPVEFWRGVASRVFQPLDVRCDDRAGFWARSVGYDLCDITVTHTRSEASEIVRTRRTIEDHDPGLLLLVLHLHGRYGLTQDDRSDVCAAGDMAIFDSARPFTARSDGPIDILTLTVPKPRLGSRARSAPRIPGDAGRAVLVRQFLAGLLDGLHAGEIAQDDEAVADGVVSLVRMLASDGSAPEAPRPLRAVQRWIDAHLGDPDLTPQRIADAHYMSRRRLYTLFEPEGCGVSEWIRRRRLEACRRELRDPAHRHETVMTIATRWGFVDASHFTHRFREVYGEPPSGCR